MKRTAFWFKVPLVAAILALTCGTAQAQPEWTQAASCPGWNNPLNFMQAANVAMGTKYEGKVGSKYDSAPNAVSGNTGVNWSSTTLTAAQMWNSGSGYQVSNVGGDNATFPNGFQTDRAFAIYSTTTQATGHPANKDPNTSDQLSFVPTQYNTNDTTGLLINTQLTRSIRVGTGRGRSGSSENNSAAVWYSMYVTPENAMLFIYYSCVFESPSHSAGQNPAYMIRVMKETSPGSNQWVQASPTRPSLATHNDTLAYFINSNGASDGVNGWHQVGSGYSAIFYKDWAKVVLNLTGLMYKNVRIEVMVNGCSMTQHWAYGYLCGECRPMVINSSGCPSGQSTDVATLAGPTGLLSYQWFASEYGVSENTNDLLEGGENEYFTFRPLTEEMDHDTAYKYHVQADDFKVNYRPNPAHVQGITPLSNTATGDSMGNRQTFRCTMKSALDPNKEFYSHLYVNVTNSKPTMEIDTLALCGGDVHLWNTSYVPGNPSKVNADATVWSFYNNPECLGTADTTMVGDTVMMHYDGGEIQGVRVRTYTHLEPNEDECYSEEVYTIRPLPNPQGGITIEPSSRILCDDAAATLHDTTGNSTYRVWRFRDSAEDSDMELTDTVTGQGEQNRNYTRSFSHAVEPIELLVRNGLYRVNKTNIYDTIWCENVLHDTVRVFLHPELEVIGDTIVCQGTTTDATVNAIGVDNCQYQWSTSLGNITGGLAAGNHLAVVPYADTATYFVRVTSEQGCVAWDSIHAYMVKPELTMLPADGRICTDDVVTLTGSKATSYTWTASPEDPSLAGQDTNAVIHVTPQRNTTYTLVGHGGSGDHKCDATALTANVTVFPYPVPTVKLTPGIVDSESPEITLRDDSPYSVSSVWTFDGGETSVGREVTHTFEEAVGVDSVYVTLTAANEMGCETVYPFGIPVNTFTAWFPNVFTPGSEDENANFRLYTINAYEHFHIYVYNRRGELVFDSNDPAFEWDGTSNGSPCPQGGYVYVCRFRKPGTYNIITLHGSVTLVR